MRRSIALIILFSSLLCTVGVVVFGRSFSQKELDVKTEPVSSVTFAIGGDVMLTRGVASTYLKSGLTKVAEKLGKDAFFNADARIVNFEGALVNQWRAKPGDRSLIFHFPPESLDVLKYWGINGASLANNHSANAGKTSLEYTRAELVNAGIQPIGGPASADSKNTAQVARFEGRGMRLAVVGVHALVAVPDLTLLIKDLKADPLQRVIIFPHWGNEYQGKHAVQQERLAKTWIDAGADAVIGAHPHVVQDVQIYKGRPIVYSLGNLIFDQYFSRATQEGLLASGEFTEAGLTMQLHPIQSVRSQPSFMTGVRRQEVIAVLLKGVDQQYQVKDDAVLTLFFPY